MKTRNTVRWLAFLLFQAILLRFSYSETIPELRELLECSAPLDLAVLMDAQTIQYKGFTAKSLAEAKILLLEILNSLPAVSREGTHVSIGTISKKPHIALRFSDLKGPKNTLMNVYRVLKHVRSETIHGDLVGALGMAVKMFHDSGARENAKKVLLVITDGIHESNTPLDEVADKVKSQGIDVVALRVSRDDYDIGSLITMATSHLSVFSAGGNMNKYRHVVKYINKALKVACK